jgi:DNA-binding CsgD family transcriptional regulator
MQQAIPQIIDHIYDAAIDPVLWPGVMREMASLVNSPTALIELHDFAADSFSFLALHPDYPVEANDEYNARWVHADPFRQKAERLAGGRLRTEIDLAPAEGVTAAEIYNDYYIKWGWGRGVGGYIMRTSTEAALLGFQRSAKDSAYTREEVNAVNEFAPHIGRAVEVNRRLNRADLTREMCENAMDLADDGLIVLDTRGRVLFANALAEAVLAARDGLSVERQTLRAHSAQDRILLETAIGKALLATGEGRSATSCVIRRRSGPPLRLLVSPFGPRGGRRPGALIVITNPDDELTKLADTLADRHDLTPAEARVAAALCRGYSPAAIAAMTKISVHTVRSHLKNIQWKIGVRGQAQIVAELLRGPGFVTKK